MTEKSSRRLLILLHFLWIAVFFLPWLTGGNHNSLNIAPAQSVLIIGRCLILAAKGQGGSGIILLAVLLLPVCVFFFLSVSRLLMSAILYCLPKERQKKLAWRREPYLKKAEKMARWELISTVAFFCLFSVAYGFGLFPWIGAAASIGMKFALRAAYQKFKDTEGVPPPIKQKNYYDFSVEQRWKTDRFHTQQK